MAGSTLQGPNEGETKKDYEKKLHIEDPTNYVYILFSRNSKGNHEFTALRKLRKKTNYFHFPNQTGPRASCEIFRNYMHIVCDIRLNGDRDGCCHALKIILRTTH